MKILKVGYTASINTGNAAFDDEPQAEVLRICKKIEESISQGKTCGKCVDLNGNSVGTWKAR